MKQTYFLGSNGKNGFFSRFSQLNSKLDGQYTYILKGGPGTGKSTIMKKIADELEKRDLDCERILCSSDPSSLDAVIFPSLRVSVADGVAPHAMDPEYPGATGEIVNLGECWDGKKLFENRKKIIELTDKNAERRRRSRRFIESAFSIFEDGEKICRGCLDERRLARYVSRTANRRIKRAGGKIGLEKIRLLDAVTPRGYIFLSDAVRELCDEIIVFEDDFGTAACKAVEELRSYALASGFSVVSSPSVADGKSVRHIVIKELSLGFATADRLCEIDLPEAKRTSLRRFYSAEELSKHKARLAFSRKAARELMDEAVLSLRAAKEIHDELEAVYGEAVDYSKTERVADELIKRIWESEWRPGEE